MTYQPPILGSKQLLNFTADSWPAVGGWLAVVAFLLGVVALFPLVRRARTSKVVAEELTGGAKALAVIALLLVVGCSQPKMPRIAYGRADCEQCHMRIVDHRFGGLAITAKGKTNQFDSIECLANYSRGVTGLRAVWVTDFDHPGTLVDATTARFVRKSGPTSEMGANLLAFAVNADTAAIRQRFGTGTLSWSDVQQLAKRLELRTVAAIEHHHDS